MAALPVKMAVTGIVEHKDASEAQRQIRNQHRDLIAGGADLKRWLAKLTNNNAQGEYYITDIIAMAHRKDTRSSQCIRSA